MSDKTPPAGAAQSAVAFTHIPHNLPAGELLALLRARKATRFFARQIAPGTHLKINGKDTGLALRGWAVVANHGTTLTPVVVGLSEGDAKARAEQLNRGGAVATGYHLYN